MEVRINMTLKEYQEKAMTTCLPSSKNFSYMMLNLVGEVGELASKIGKQIRKGNCVLDNNHILTKTVAEEEINNWKKEAGDVLWQLSGLCSTFGWDLEDIAKMNLDKLAKRKDIGTIDGSGDGIIREK